MNKTDFCDLMKEHLEELDTFDSEIKKVKKLIYLVSDSFEFLKSDITDEQIFRLSSELGVKSTKINSLIKDIFSDSKKLESFLNEIKILKRKRERKIVKKSPKEQDVNYKVQILIKKQRELREQMKKYKLAIKQISENKL